MITDSRLKKENLYFFVFKKEKNGNINIKSYLRKE